MRILPSIDQVSTSGKKRLLWLVRQTCMWSYLEVVPSV